MKIADQAANPIPKTPKTFQKARKFLETTKT